MDWLPPIEKAWGLYLALVGLLGAAVRGILKAHYYKEQIDTVTKHDSQIKDIQASVDSLKHDVSRVGESLDKHNSKQDGDMSAILTLLLEMSNTIKALPGINPEFNDAHKDFQKHLVKRKGDQK